MSTKFSVRPAPRKKPWVCKRSPPCLIPPPFPPTLLATFSKQQLIPPPPGLHYTGSFIIEWTALPDRYEGTWTDAANTYALTFFYDPVTALGRAQAITLFAGFPDMGFFPTQKMRLPPKLLFYTESLTAFGFPSKTALTIT